MVRIWLVMLVFVLALGSVERSARAASPELETRLIEDAIATVAAMKETNAPEFEPLWRRTKAVIVVPNLARGGWIIGGEFGTGLLLVRRTDAAAWSDPVFFSLASGSVGLQFGADLSQLMLVITADNAVKKLLTGQVRLGADVGFAAGPVGRGAQVGRVVDENRTDIFALSIVRTGLFGGVAMKGGVLVPNRISNARFYGDGIRPDDIVTRAPGGNAGTLRLRAALVSFMDGLTLEPLEVAQAERREVAARPEKRRDNDDASNGPRAVALSPLSGERVVAESPPPGERVRKPLLFSSTSLSAEDLEGTRRTPAEGPVLSTREGQIVDSLRRNELR